MTEHEKVLKVLLDNQDHWLHSFDFIGDRNDVFLSHRGPARVSELARDYPELIETDNYNRTYRYRIHPENIQVLPDKLKGFLIKYIDEKANS